MNNQTIEELNNRYLDPCLISIIVIPISIYHKESEYLITQKRVYVFFSCNIHGVRKYITSVFESNFPKTSDWYDFLLNIKQRGINVCLYAVIPNDNNLAKALQIAFPNVSVCISCFDPINKLSKYYTIGYTSNILKHIRAIFLSEDLNCYNLAINNFKEEYGNTLFISDILDSDLKRAKKYYDLPLEVRNFIFSFYFYRDISKNLYKIINSKDYFSSLDELISLFIPNIILLEKRMFCSKNQLINVINFLYSSNKELIISYL